MKKIKVLEVIRQGEIGGGESHLIDLVSGFSDDIEPIILSFTYGHMIDILSAKNIKCHIINTQRPFNIFIQQKIIKILKEEHIDIIHVHGSRAASNMLFSSFITKIPMIYTVHGWSFHQGQNFINKKIRIISEKIICMKSKLVICVSNNNKQLGEKLFRLSNAIVIENGVNLNKFCSQSITEDTNIFRNNINDFIVSFIGRITAQKAPKDFIDSISIAHKADDRIKGVIIGEGDLLEKVKNYINKNKCSDYIQLQKFRNDIPLVLKSSDVFALPSLWEGLSIALLEAMAMKKAIVATPTDGTRDIIVDHQTGIIVPYNDPKKLADAYIEYLNSEEKRTVYGENAHKIVEKRFNSQRVSDKVADIYKTIIK